jgi:hypothetical protein
VAHYLWGWLKALRWERLPEMEKVGDTLVKHFDGIAAYCDHRVRFGVVESLNTTIKAVLRRARGMRDEVMLLLKLKWAIARPIRSSSDLAKFVNFQHGGLQLVPVIGEIEPEAGRGDDVDRQIAQRDRGPRGTGLRGACGRDATRPPQHSARARFNDSLTAGPRSSYRIP